MKNPHRIVSAEERAAAMAEVGRQLAALDRTSFKDILGDLIEATPSVESLRAFALQHPDRWAQALVMIGQLAGFERGALVQLNILNVQGKSDAELMEIARSLPALARADSRLPVTIEQAPEIPAASALGPSAPDGSQHG